MRLEGSVISKKLLLTAAVLAASGHAVRAQGCGSRSGDEIIASCDAAFAGSGLLITAARGWCYLVNAAACGLP
jgi:hypothetical protein